MKIELSPVERQYLKGLAHTLNPVVMIGNNGLTDAVMREIAISLDAHELIKIRVQGDDRDARIAMYEQICDDLDAAPVVWRPSDKQRIVPPKSKKALKAQP